MEDYQYSVRINKKYLNDGIFHYMSNLGEENAYLALESRGLFNDGFLVYRFKNEGDAVAFKLRFLCE